MHSYQHFTVQTGANGDEVQIKISETPGVIADNLPLSTWGSSAILANQLHRIEFECPQDNPSIIPVLELGAGTSLVGISAAAVWRTPVIVTDLAGIVPGLAQNITINQALLDEQGASARCGTLDWTRPEKIELHSDSVAVPNGTHIANSTHKARVILAADTIYDEEHPHLLTQTILAWLEKHAMARVVLAYPVRIAYLEQLREIWSMLELNGLECMQEGKEAGDGSFDDLAPYEWCVWRWRL